MYQHHSWEISQLRELMRSQNWHLYYDPWFIWLTNNSFRISKWSTSDITKSMTRSSIKFLLLFSRKKLPSLLFFFAELNTNKTMQKCNLKIKMWVVLNNFSCCRNLKGKCARKKTGEKKHLTSSLHNQCISFGLVVSAGCNKLHAVNQGKS